VSTLLKAVNAAEIVMNQMRKINRPPTYTDDCPDKHASAQYTSKHHDDDVKYTPV